jgi:hypothetical protein
MSLSQITDPRAVDSAIDEYDRLTRDEFLRKYKFGRSLKYFVVRDGRRYDSKAILGAAHGYQYPDRGPLKPGDFSGGEAQTVPKLRSLGFQIVTGTEDRDADPSGTRQFWAIVANPSVYDIDAALAAGVVESWSSRGKPMRPGDGVILWRTRGHDHHRGIIAMGEVSGEPYRSADEDDPFWIDREAAERVEERVPVRLTRVPGLPLWTDGAHRQLLESLPVARAKGGTVFRLTPEQWSAIRSALDFDAGGLDAVVEEISSPFRQPDGQGRGLSAAERRLVELHAMEMAKRHYCEKWETVEDVTSKRCYDLECRTGDRVLRVEVKGTTGGGTSVLLTTNEVEHARAQQPHVALFVVSEIQLRREPGSEPVASGGTVRILEPWDVRACELRPMAYECRLP